MICPLCHSDTRVIRTIKYSTCVKRERVCINSDCHLYCHKFTTSEEIDENSVEMLETGVAI